MAQRLLNDCFLHGDERITHAEALAVLSARIVPVAGQEPVALEAAAGRILARAIDAPHPVPNHTNAAVDGYAFAAADYDRRTGARLAVAGRAAAGRAYRGSVPAGSAIRIFTGAVVPDGLDSVAMQEDCSVDTAGVVLPAGLKPGLNVRRAGEDVAMGQRLYEPGHVLRPQDLAALASIGMGEAACYRRLKVGIVSSGDEVVRAGTGPLAHGKVFDANAPMLSALVAACGAQPVDLGIWADSAEAVRERLSRAAEEHDLILTSGGASRGDEDHMAAALDALGSRHFWQIQIKPGRPMMLGQVGDTVVAGLPGNPVAVFVCFLMYVWPMLRRLGGADWSEPRRIPAKAAFEFPKRKTGRREFWRGMLRGSPGGLVVDKYARDGSGLISSLREANCLIDIPEDVPAIASGDTVAVVPFTEFGIV